MRSEEQKKKALLPCVLGLDAKEAVRRLQSADALVSSIHYSSKKGVYDADAMRVIRQRVLREEPLEVELIVVPCRIAIREAAQAKKEEK